MATYKQQNADKFRYNQTFTAIGTIGSDSYGVAAERSLRIVVSGADVGNTIDVKGRILTGVDASDWATLATITGDTTGTTISIDQIDEIQFESTNFAATDTSIEIWASGFVNITPAQSVVGDVDGPLTSTDNAIALWDGVSGDLLSDSSIIVSDTSDITGVKDLTMTGNLSVNGNTTLGDAGADAVTINASTITVANDTNVVLSGGVNGLSFDTNLLSLDATNDRIGIGQTAPTAKLHLTGTVKAGGEVTILSAPANHTAIVAAVPNHQFSGNTIELGGNLVAYTANVFNFPTITAAAPQTVTLASNTLIGGLPIPAGSAVITNSVALLVTPGVPAAAAPTTIDTATALGLSIAHEGANVTINEAIGIGQSYPSAATQASEITALSFDFDTNFTTSPSALTGLYLNIDGTDVTDKNFIILQKDGSDQIIFDINGGAVFNQAGNAGADFRVESDGSENAIKVDSTNNRVGIFTASPTVPFEVTGNSLFTGDVTINGSSITLSQDTNVVLSGGVNGLSFNSTTLSIDASNNRVGVGTTAPDARFHTVDSSNGPGALIEVNNATVDSEVPIFNVKRATAGDMVDGFGGRFNFLIEDGTAIEPIAHILAKRSGADNTGMAIISTNTLGVEQNQIKLTPTEIILNDDSLDIDTRIESNGNSSAVFVDSGNDRVGIFTAAPTVPLEVTGNTIINGDITVTGTINGAATGDIVMGPAAATDTAVALFDGVTGKLLKNSGVLVDASNNITGVNNLTLNGGTVTLAVDTNFVTSGGQNGFSVDGTTFTVDGNLNYVGIGTATPAVVLHITEDSTGSATLIVDNPNTGTSANALVQVQNGTGGANQGRGYIISYNSNYTDFTKETSFAKACAFESDSGSNLAISGYGGNIYFTQGTDRQERMKIGTSDIVINESAKDLDIRIETASNQNAFVIDSGNSRIGLFTAAPSVPFEVTGNSLINGKLSLAVNNSDDSSILTIESSNNVGTVGASIAFRFMDTVGADNDLIGDLFFTGKNDAGAEINYGRMFVQAASAAAGAEVGNFIFQTFSANTPSERFRVSTSGATVTGDLTVTGTITGTISGGGDVVGPASSVDNTLPRFDSTTGKLLQGSGIVVDDSNNMTVPGNLTVQGTQLDISNNGVNVVLKNQVGALTFDSTLLTLNKLNSRIGIGSASPGSRLTILQAAKSGGEPTLTIVPGAHSAITAQMYYYDLRGALVSIGSNMAEQIFTNIGRTGIGQSAGAAFITKAVNTEIAGCPYATSNLVTLTNTTNLRLTGGTLEGTATYTTAQTLEIIPPNDSTVGTNATNIYAIKSQYASAITQKNAVSGLLLDFDTNFTTNSAALTGLEILIDATDTTSKKFLSLKKDTTEQISFDISGGAIFNEAGNAGADFRVESDGLTHALFVDSTNNRTLVGTSAPSLTPTLDGSVAAAYRFVSQTADNIAGYFESTNAGATGAVLTLAHASATPAINDAVGTLLFQGSTDVGGTKLYGKMECLIVDPAAASLEGSLKFSIVHTATTFQELLLLKKSEVVVNDGSFDVDFRVESNGDANCLFVNGGEDRVYIGSNSNAFNSKLQVLSTSTNLLTLQSSDTGNQGPIINLYHNSADPANSDVVGSILFIGNNSAAGNVNYGLIRSDILDVTNATEDANLRFYAMTGGVLTEKLNLGATLSALGGRFSVTTNGAGTFASPGNVANGPTLLTLANSGSQSMTSNVPLMNVSPDVHYISSAITDFDMVDFKAPWYFHSGAAVTNGNNVTIKSPIGGNAGLTNSVNLKLTGKAITVTGGSTPDTLTTQTLLHMEPATEGTGSIVSNAYGIRSQYITAVTQNCPQTGIIIDYDTNHTTSADALTVFESRIDSTNTTSKNHVVLKKDTTVVASIDINGNTLIGGSSITAGAILDVQSTTAAFMPPRMTTTEKNAITGVAGMVVYDTSLNKLCVYTGAAWETITSA